jgi:hypothetical protein
LIADAGVRAMSACEGNANATNDGDASNG